MIELTLNLFVFFVISLVYFYSLTGYGKILINKSSNFFDLQIDGTIILLLTGYFLYLSIGINQATNFLILTLGIIFFFFYKKGISTIKLKYIFILLTCVFSVLVISKTHEDFNTYHLFSIYEVYNNNLRLGVSKLNGYFVHSSHLILNQGLTVIPYLNFKILHLPIFFIYFSTIGYFTSILFNKNSKSQEIFFSILCVLILLIKFNRLSEYGYDYVAQYLLLIVFHKIFFLNHEDQQLIKALIYFIFSILIKPVSLLFSPILIFILYKKGFSFYKKITIKNYVLISLLLVTIISSSFFKTGCLFYPLNSTCFSKDKIFWSEKSRLKDYSRTVSLWAKSYDAQNDSKYNKISDKEIFLKNFNWINVWIEKHFFYKISEFLLIVSLLILMIYFYFNKIKSADNQNIKEKLVIFFLSFLSIIFWLNTVPQFRFGFASIIIFLFIIFNLILNLKIKFNKKKFIHFFIFGLLVLNLKNFNRINNEFQRDDFYKFTNFPFFNEKKINNNYSNLKRQKYLHIEILK